MAHQKPERTFRLGSVSCSVFANDRDGKTYRSVVLQRSYRDVNGNWQSTTALNAADLPVAMTLLQAALDFTLPQELESADTT